MLPDPERTAQASRIYALLLKCYPVSFQQEYGDVLIRQFKDEHQDALAAGKQFSMLRFWWFIGFDFTSSLLMEIQEEVTKMMKKNFFVFCAIAAGLVTFILCFPMRSSHYFINRNVDVWAQYLIFPLFIGSGALTLYGIAKVSGSHLIIKGVALIVLFFSASLLPKPYNDPGRGWVPRPIFKFLEGNNEDRVLTYFFAAYFLLIGIVSIAAFTKKKWLPGGCLFAMIFPQFLSIAVSWCSIDSPFISNMIWYSDWYPKLYFSLLIAAWFAIAWWFYQEDGKTPVQEGLEAT